MEFHRHRSCRGQAVPYGRTDMIICDFGNQDKQQINITFTRNNNQKDTENFGNKGNHGNTSNQKCLDLTRSLSVIFVIFQSKLNFL